VIDDQLAASVKHFGQRLAALRSVKRIGRADLHPGQRAALFGKCVARMRQRFFFGQMRLVRRQPFFPRNNSMRFHICILLK
jgi:hypothetical protein